MTAENHHTVKTLNMSLLTEVERLTIINILKKHKVNLTQITAAQHLRVFGLSDEEFDVLQREVTSIITSTPGITVTYVQSCPGLEHCKYAINNSLSLGRKIEKITLDTPLPHKIKVSIAGCRICCTEPYVRDVGVIAERHGWKVVFGGNGGGKPRIADVIQAGLSDRDVVHLVKKCLQFYVSHATKKQRTARFIEQFGSENFRKKVLLQ